MGGGLLSNKLGLSKHPHTHPPMRTDQKQTKFFHILECSSGGTFYPPLPFPDHGDGKNNDENEDEADHDGREGDNYDQLRLFWKVYGI